MVYNTVEFCIVHAEASLHGQGCSLNACYLTLDVLFEGDGIIAAEILGVTNVVVFASTEVVRGSHITCSCVSRSVQIPSRCQSLGRNIFNIHKIYSLKTGPLQHLGVLVHLMRLASLRRMFVAI